MLHVKHNLQIEMKKQLLHSKLSVDSVDHYNSELKIKRIINNLKDKFFYSLKIIFA
jgi:hypothetical protein